MILEHTILKAVAGLGVMSIAAIVEGLDYFEGAVQRIGLPLLCAGGFAYAIVILSRKYKESTDARIEDAKEYAARLEETSHAHASRLEEHIVKGAESRAELIQVSKELKDISIEQLKAQAKTVIAMEHMAQEISKCTSHGKG